MPIPEVCPTCLRPVSLLPSGWWSHDGAHGDCWRLSMDGPDDAFAEEYSSIIETARELDPAFAADAGPGRYEGETLPELTAAVDSIGLAGMADATGGASDVVGHGTRVGRFVVVCDCVGFRTLEVFGDEADAQAFVDDLDEAV